MSRLPSPDSHNPPSRIPGPIQADDWVLREEEPLYGPVVQGPRQIATELLIAAYKDKSYAVSDASEVVINSGDIKSITILETGRAAVVYKVRYADDAVGFGSVEMSDGDDGGLNILHMTDDLLSLSMRELAVRGDVVESRLALVSAIIRDFFVCEQRDKLYAPASPPRKRPGRGQKPGLTVRYLPRVKVRFVGISEREFAASKTSVVGHSVSGHLRRVRIRGSAEQLALAREYSVSVPDGFTFVRPHKRGEVNQVIYRSRSALELVFGRRAEDAGVVAPV